jgi:subtilase family serine protease
LASKEISQAGRRFGAIGAVAALLAAGSGMAAPAADAAVSAATVRIGAAPSIPGGSKLIAAPSAAQKLGLDVTLKPRNESALAGFVKAVSTPGSPAYHQYLSKGQFAATFGPTQATITATENALKADGLKVTSVSSDGLTISVTTTVAGAKSAFGVEFSGYKLADGRSVYANTSAPALPATVAGDVSAIVGLDNVAAIKSNVQLSSAAAKEVATEANTPAKPGAAKSNTVKPGYSAPTTCSEITDDFGQAGYSDGDGYYSPSALASIYKTDTQLAAGDNGSGVTVGVFELEGIDLTGVSDYENCFGVHNPVTVEKIDGGATIPVDANNDDGIETGLDVQTIAGLAPGVSIIDYEGPDAVNASDAQLEDVYQRMVTDDTVKVISTSWGECEVDTDAPVFAAENTIFEEAAAQGQSVVAASGDDGSTACYGHGSSNGAVVNTDDPASQPYVLGVGGTTMQGLNNPTPSVWNNSYGASGGGVSSEWPLTSGGYQAGFTGSGYHNACGASSGEVCRQVPDVSALADPNEGYIDFVYTSASTDPVTGEYYPAGEYFYSVGGTSGAAPVWAAVLALADASKDCAADGPVGLVNPALYASQTPGSATSGIVTDVASGTNVDTESGYYGPDYSATAGYDLTSGLGTPLAGGVVTAACKAVPTTTSSYYVPFGPTRILDTRSGIGLGGKLGANAVGKLQVGGQNGIPVGVTAVVMNLTVTNTTGNGFITAYPDGGATPNASNVNFVKGQTVPNLAVVPVGTDGKIDLSNAGALTGPLDVIGDVSGYFMNSSVVGGASTYTALTPFRAIDTRGAGLNGISGPLAKDGTDTLTVAGLGGIGGDPTAVVANITVTDTNGNGLITAYPAGGTVPGVSNVNFTKGQTVANSAIIPVSQGGQISFTNSGAITGSVDLIVDISGYFTAGTGGETYHSVYPDRLLDTRSGIGEANAGKIGKNGTLGLSLGDTGTTLASSNAIIANITVTDTTGSGLITAYPSSLSSVPNVSNVNFSSGQTVPNLAIITNTNGTIDFNNAGTLTGPLDLIVDVSGYFS